MKHNAFTKSNYDNRPSFFLKQTILYKYFLIFVWLACAVKELAFQILSRERIQ